MYSEGMHGKTDKTMAKIKGKKDKPWPAKHYTEN
jgi:hypothetical protein